MLIESNETFLSEMTKLFQKNQNKSIYITMKRFDSSDRKAKKSRTSAADRQDRQAERATDRPTEHSSQSSAENKCLIRVHTCHQKISTTVSAKDVNKFQLAYANLLKGNLYGLKKRDNKKKSNVKSKATQ